MPVVNISVKDAEGTASTGDVFFTLQSTPLEDSTDFVLGQTVKATLSSGAASITLVEGTYSVRFGDTNETVTAVVTAGGPHDLTDLVT